MAHSAKDLARLFDREPPHDAVAEQALIGALLLDHSRFEEVNGILGGASAFYTQRFAVVYDAIRENVECERGGDLVALCATLRGWGQLDAVGGAEGLAAMGESAPSVVAAPHYARIVANAARLRSIIDAAGRAIFEAYHAGASDSEEVAGLIGRTAEAFEAITVPAGGLGAVLLDMSKVEPEPVRWLWTHRIPACAITVVAGDPEASKSFLTLDIAARITTGAPWPDDTRKREPAGVLLVCGEDSPTQVVCPRLRSAGADMKRVRLLTGIRTSRSKKRGEEILNLAEHQGELAKAIRDTPGCAAVVIDPIGNHLGGVDSHKDADLRSRALGPLAKSVQDHGVAGIVVAHLKKGSEQTAIYRVMGSIGFTGIARSCLMVSLDPDDRERVEAGELRKHEARRVLRCEKSSLGPSPDTLHYRLCLGHDAAVPPFVKWEGVWTPQRPASILGHSGGLGEKAGRAGRPADRQAEATQALADLLASGPMPSGQVYAKVRASTGASDSTIDRAVKALSLTREERPIRGGGGYAGRAVWLALPAVYDRDEDESVPATPEGRQQDDDDDLPF